MRVWGEDLNYPKTGEYSFINPARIKSVHPNFAVKSKDDGRWWRSTSDYPNAELVNYKIVYDDGKIFQCGVDDQLSIIGLSMKSMDIDGESKSPIGFLSDKIESKEEAEA